MLAIENPIHQVDLNSLFVISFVSSGKGLEPSLPPHQGDILMGSAGFNARVLVLPEELVPSLNPQSQTIVVTCITAEEEHQIDKRLYEAIDNKYEPKSHS